MVENARRRQSLKRGGDAARLPLDAEAIAAPKSAAVLPALDESLDRLADHDAAAGELVKLRYFSGLTIAQAAMVLNISARSADRLWAYAKAWLYRDSEGSQPAVDRNG